MKTNTSSSERAAELVLVTLSRPNLKDRSLSAVAKKVAHKLNEEGHHPSSGRYFTAPRVVKLLAPALAAQLFDDGTPVPTPSTPPPAPTGTDG